MGGRLPPVEPRELLSNHVTAATMGQLICDGWWEQDFYGRQPMESLTLSFDGGTVQGSGGDIVGPFTLQGTLDRGNVVLKKQYLGRHAVAYIGTYDGEGTMRGEWQINEFRGRWMIRLRAGRSVDRADTSIKQIRPPQRG